MRKYHFILKGLSVYLLLASSKTMANPLAFADITCTESSIRYSFEWVGDEGSIRDVVFATFYFNGFPSEDYGSVLQSQDVANEQLITGPGPHDLRLVYLYDEREFEINQTVDCNQSANSAGTASSAGIGAGSIHTGTNAPTSVAGMGASSIHSGTNALTSALAGSAVPFEPFSWVEVSCEDGNITVRALPEIENFVYDSPEKLPTVTASENITGFQKQVILERNIRNISDYQNGVISSVIEDVVGGRVYQLEIEAYYTAYNNRAHRSFYYHFTYSIPQTVYCAPYERINPGSGVTHGESAGAIVIPQLPTQPEVKEYQVKVINSCPAKRIYFDAAITGDIGSYQIGPMEILISDMGYTSVTTLETSSGLNRFPSTTLPSLSVDSIYVVNNPTCKAYQNYNSTENTFEIYVSQ